MSPGLNSGDLITNYADLLHRQIPAAWFVGGRPCEHAFRPKSNDDGELSVYWGNLIGPEESFKLHKTNNCKSAGVFSLSVDECQTVALPVHFDPKENNPSHSFVNFKDVLEKTSRIAKSIILRDYALTRGATFLPKGSESQGDQEKATA